LRGGGGGSFGVVTRVSLRTFPDVPVVQATLGFGVSQQEPDAFWAGITDFHSHLVEINDAGGSGYYSIFSTPENDTAPLTFGANLLFLEQTSTVAVGEIFAPLMADWLKTVGPRTSLVLSTLPSTKAGFSLFLQGDSDITGDTRGMTSRLISRDLLGSREGAARLSDALSQLIRKPGKAIGGHVVAGGAVASSRVDSAVNPAWRRAVTHLAAGESWDPVLLSPEEQREITDRITNVDGAILRSLEPDMGAYLNEADANEVDFQKSFWGDKYPKLFRIKKRWDPEGLFIVKPGVGSEEWDEDGLCWLKG
jgi:FAD/FMN-containing dehydrogenase